MKKSNNYEYLRLCEELGNPVKYVRDDDESVDWAIWETGSCVVGWFAIGGETFEISVLPAGSVKKVVYGHREVEAAIKDALTPPWPEWVPLVVYSGVLVTLVWCAYQWLA